MFEFFSNVQGWLEMIGDFLMSLLNGLLQFLLLLNQVLVLPVTLSMYMPSIIGVSVTVVTSIAVIKLIVGR